MTPIKFTLSAKAFASALAQVTPVVANNAVIPALENVKLTVSGSEAGKRATMRLMCSNLETELQVTLDVDCHTDFAAAVPAKKLLALLKTLPDAPLTCVWNGESYAFDLSIGRSKYKLAGENASDFPLTRASGPTTLTISMSCHTLRAALSATMSLCSTDELRQAMTGVYVEATASELRFVATDGHRVGYWQADAGDDSVAAYPLPNSYLIPRSAAALLLAQLDPKSDQVLTLIADATNVRTADGRWVTRLIDERFPEYRNVIPELRHHNIAIVDRDELLTTMRRLENVANEKTRQVQLFFKSDGLVASAQDIDFSREGQEVVACEFDGEEVEIGFNASYITQTLALLPAGLIRIAMSTPNRAAMFTPANNLASDSTLFYLVMPTQIIQHV